MLPAKPMTEPDDVPFGMHVTNLAPWEQSYAVPVDEPEREADDDDQ